MTFTNVATAVRHLRSRVCETVRGPSVSVRPSVCPNRSTATTPDGGFADEGPAANDFGRQLWTPALSSKRRGQRHFDSRRRRLNTDYLDATSTRLRWPTPQIKIADILQ